ncbi:uncharacterized protein LOC121858707 [Homarus americanus]|uniref:Uncharacterized protein n=1 Tax=Homarus americanus TaxID=6706 RepID=A0A8J5N930_HOMAM|nr:uncharacterized protein LOC121858707 [Homarus americanus]KAG7175059.1 hypothetical protein Hamer_G015279 [Homarus americanus]
MTIMKQAFVKKKDQWCWVVVMTATLLTLLRLYHPATHAHSPNPLHYSQEAAEVTSWRLNSSRFRVQLPDTCECRSMFTVGACGLEGVAEMRAGDAAWVRAVKGLGIARTQLDETMMPHLATLARYMPQVFTANVTSATAASSHVKIEADPHLTRAATSLPFLPCEVHLYTPAEVLTCTRRYLAHTGAPLRIAFVGDSRVRNTMQQMIRGTLHHLQYRLEGDTHAMNDTLGFLDSKAKVNIPVVGDGLHLRLHWSTFLHRQRQPDDVSRQGARDLLEAWASGTPGPQDGPVPDIIYVTSGLWDTSMSSGDEAVSDFMYTLQVMTPILNKLARRSRVLWHVHGPIKAWLAIREVPNGALDMINRAAWAKLGHGGVWLWDSHTVMMLRQHTECRALHQAGLAPLTPTSWGCRDFQHAGKDVEDGATNMLWNLACNALLHLPQHHCCAH